MSYPGSFNKWDIDFFMYSVMGQKLFTMIIFREMAYVGIHSKP